MWIKGESNGMKYEVKYYDKGSDWGIDGGRISKLYIGKGGNNLMCLRTRLGHSPQNRRSSEAL